MVTVGESTAGTLLADVWTRSPAPDGRDGPPQRGKIEIIAMLSALNQLYWTTGNQPIAPTYALGAALINTVVVAEGRDCD